jgi:uncharacterized protein YlxW (UPF0749 family)
MARPTKPEDSLELLLDTMCNAFGGIIMIAILVALLIKDTKQAEKGPSAAVQASMVQRKLKQTRDELQSAQELKERLEKQLQQSADAAKLVQERDALQKQVQELAARASAAESLLRSTTDPTEARSKKDAIENKKAELQREMAEMEKNAKELSEKMMKLEKALADARAKRTIELGPPPAERQTTKAPFNLIFRSGRLYPLHALGPNGMTINQTDVKWTPVKGGQLAEPIPGAGIAAEKDEAAVRDFIAVLKKVKAGLDPGAELYVASYVYPDSFAAYLRFKQTLTAANTGIGQGWEPVKLDDELRFGATGFKPGEQ